MLRMLVAMVIVKMREIAKTNNLWAGVFNYFLPLPTYFLNESGKLKGVNRAN